MKLYEELAEYYFSIESHHREIRNDITFIKSFIPVGNRVSILDLGCGTGEHLEILSRDGHRCAGIDSSRQMLAVARRRGNGAIEYDQRSVVDFDYFEEFDIVISLFGSLDYVLDDDEFDAVLWNIWRALRAGGVALLEIWNSFPILQIGSKELGHVSTTRSGNVIIDRARGFKTISKSPTIVEVSYRYNVKEDDNEKILEDTHQMRAFSKDELELFAAKNGFRFKSFYANTSKEGFSDVSNRIIIVIEK
jgi:SAM-dependent methyltransferase